MKKKFIKEPGQIRLLIVVDKLLTGFDAPPDQVLQERADDEAERRGRRKQARLISNLGGDGKERKVLTIAAPGS